MFKIDPLAPAAETLEINDVVLEIEGVPIADDGTVEFRNEERVEFSHIVRSKHIGELPEQLLGQASIPYVYTEVHIVYYCRARLQRCMWVSAIHSEPSCLFADLAAQCKAGCARHLHMLDGCAERSQGVAVVMQ